MNQFLGSLALVPVEKIVNAIVDRDPHIAQQLLGFDSKCIEIFSEHPNFSVNLSFEEGAIRLSAIDSETLGIKPDATISGRAENLLGLLLKKPEQRALADADIEITGDATLIQDLHVTIQSLDVDWQDYLTPILGDVLSNELGAIHNSAREWGQSASSSVHRSVRDYLSEEARLVPSELELDSFSNRLDQLRLRIDRLTAKTELLQRQVTLLTK